MNTTRIGHWTVFVIVCLAAVVLAQVAGQFAAAQNRSPAEAADSNGSVELSPGDGIAAPSDAASESETTERPAESSDQQPAAASPPPGQTQPGGKSSDIDRAPEESQPAAAPARRQGLMVGFTIFVLAMLLGLEVITKVPPTLHTPLMSGSNAISGITIVGAVTIAGVTAGLTPVVGMVAVALAAINVVGGFLVTHRMLMMFQRKK